MTRAVLRTLVVMLLAAGVTLSCAAQQIDDNPEDVADGHGEAGCDPVTFQLQVLDLIRAAGTPNLSVTTSHPAVSQLRIELIGADGSEYTLWDGGGGALPASFPLPRMAGAWMTGRYQLTITDLAAGTTGSVSRWCIEAN